MLFNISTQKIGALFLFIIIIGCNKIYWHRAKVSSSVVKTQSIIVQINNTVPYAFKPDFNKELKKYCEVEFARMGYKIKETLPADFVATITINKDSFPVNGSYVFSKGGSSYFWQAYKKTKVHALLFKYDIKHTINNATKWHEENDVYYFDDVYKNSRRTKNMIKYTIRYGK